MAEINWIPKFIRQFLERRPLHRVTHEEYNELFNLLINQGDHNSQGITDLYAIFGHVQGDIADLLLYGEINADKLGGFLPEYYASKEYVLTQIAAIDLTAITAQLENKVDKVDGKGLSTNDYTDADKADVAKIDGLEDALENLDVEQIFQTNVTMSNATVTHVLYATEGRVARLAVDHFLTGSSEYLAGAEYIYFQDQQHQYHRFIEGHRRDDLPQVQYTDFDGVPLYWGDVTHSYMTPTETDFPVMVYVYDLLTKREINFELDPESGFMVPKDIHGAGVGNEGHPEWGKGYDYKGVTEFIRKYYSSTGKEKAVYLTDTGLEIVNTTSGDVEQKIAFSDDGIIQTGNTGEQGLRNIHISTTEPASPQTNDLWIDTDVDFVDLKMRRIDSVNINKSLGEVTVLMEGETVPETIIYTETADSITYTWPDGHTATVSIS